MALDANNYIRATGIPGSATVSAASKFVNGVEGLSITGASVPVTTVGMLYVNGAYTTLIAQFFTGDDTMTGSNFDDVLLAGNGHDTVKGNRG